MSSGVLKGGRGRVGGATFWADPVTSKVGALRPMTSLQPWIIFQQAGLGDLHLRKPRIPIVHMLLEAAHGGCTLVSQPVAAYSSVK